MSQRTSPCDASILGYNYDTNDVIQMYGNSATIHGVPTIITPQAFKWRRYFWLFLLLGMSSALSYSLYIQFAKYAKRPVLSSITVEFSEELKLPDITICNANNFHRDRIPNEPVLQQLLFNMSDLSCFSHQLNNSEMYISGNSSDFFTGSYLRQFAEDAAHRINDMFLICQWQNQLLNCSKYFQKQFTNFGMCFTLTSRKDSPLALPVLSSSNNANYFRLIINVEQDKYYFARNSQSGIKVVLHEQNSEPSPIHQGFYVQPGTSTSVTFNINKNSWLPDPYKAFGDDVCEDMDENKYKTINYSYKYDKHACLINCSREYLYQKCGCHYFLDRGKDPYCSLIELRDCLFPHMLNISNEIFSHCHCPMACKTTEYEPKISVANFASTFIKDYLVCLNLTDSSEAIGENLIDLRIHYHALSATIKQQKPELTIEGILGSLGGYMGLFVGASVMSILELLEFLVLYLYELFKCRLKTTKKKKKTTRPQL